MQRLFLRPNAKLSFLITSEKLQAFFLKSEANIFIDNTDGGQHKQHVRE